MRVADRVHAGGHGRVPTDARIEEVERVRGTPDISTGRLDRRRHAIGRRLTSNPDGADIFRVLEWNLGERYVVECGGGDRPVLMARDGKADVGRTISVECLAAD